IGSARVRSRNAFIWFSRYSARWPAIFGNPGETLSPLGPWHEAHTWDAYLPTSASCARRDGAMHAIVIVMSEIGTITSVLIFVCLVLEGFLRPFDSGTRRLDAPSEIEPAEQVKSVVVARVPAVAVVIRGAAVEFLVGDELQRELDVLPGQVIELGDPALAVGAVVGKAGNRSGCILHRIRAAGRREIAHRGAVGAAQVIARADPERPEIVARVFEQAAERKTRVEGLALLDQGALDRDDVLVADELILAVESDVAE